MKRETKKQLLTFLILFIFLGSSISYAIIYVFPTSNSSSNPGTSIDGIECSNSEQTVYHIHVHLDVFADGQPYNVPADVGITSSCLYWLHTHDATGVIHIESPSVATYQLGQFLDIWQNSTVGANLPSGSPVTYVNGNQFSGDYRSIPLNAHDEITLVYGSPPFSIPNSYNFPQGL